MEFDKGGGVKGWVGVELGFGGGFILSFELMMEDQSFEVLGNCLWIGWGGLVGVRVVNFSCRDGRQCCGVVGCLGYCLISVGFG